MNSPIVVTLFPSGLAETVARLLQAILIQAKFQKFSDSECAVTLDNYEQFLDANVYIFQSSSMPVNDTVLGVAFLAQVLKQAGARKVILINPYFGYSRQDKSPIKGKPGHAEIIAKLYESSGIDELITVELHNPEIKKYFTIPVHELELTDVIAQQIKQHFGAKKDICLIAPDKGAYERVAKIGMLIGAGVLVFSKERYAADKTRVLGVSGTCTGQTAILIDDMIDTAGTAVNVARALMEMRPMPADGKNVKGFQEVVGFFVHPVLSGDAFDRIEKSPFSQVFVSNTLPMHGEHRKITQFDVSSVLAEFILKKV